MWRQVANAQLRAGKTEEVAFRSAWATVSRQWKKPANSSRWVHKNAAPTFGKRNVENASELVKWAKNAGFSTVIKPSELHATFAYSKAAVEIPEADDDTLVIRSQKGRAITQLGDGKAVVLKFHSPALHRRWQQLIDTHGFSWDHIGFHPHITLSYQADELDFEKMEPYAGEIILGPEIFEPIKEDIVHTEKGLVIEGLKPDQVFTGAQVRELLEKIDNSITFENPTVLKAVPKLGLVFGWAIISKVNGKEYYDTQGDHIPEESMLEAAAEFMESNRTMKFMHRGVKKGTVIFAWPLTEDTARAMKLKTNTTGLMIAVKPDSPSIFEDIQEGRITGFSIGGTRIEDEDPDEE